MDAGDGEDEGNHEDPGDHEQNLRDLRRGAGHPAETQKAGNQ